MTSQHICLGSTSCPISRQRGRWGRGWIKVEGKKGSQVQRMRTSPSLTEVSLTLVEKFDLKLTQDMHSTLISVISKTCLLLGKGFYIFLN